MTIVFLLVALAVIVVAALMVTGRWSPALGSGNPAEGPDGRGPGAVAGEERFDVVLRGYRMDQVDEAIDALKSRVRELESRA